MKQKFNLFQTTTSPSFRKGLGVGLFILLGLLGFSGQAWAATKRVYLDVSTKWYESSAKFGVNVWGGSTSGGKMMTKLSGNIYYADVADNSTKVQFIRFNSTHSSTEFSWTDEWNRIGGNDGIDIDLSDKNMMVVSDWSAGSWSRYAPTGAIVGIGDWDPAAHSLSSGSVTISLAANTTYEFKVLYGTSYYGNNSAITSSVSNWGFATSTSENCHITTAVAGDYTFAWDNTNKRLSVTYPNITHPSADYYYVKNTANWSQVNVHLFTGDTGIDNWPGPVLSSATFGGNTFYYFAAGAETTAIFSNNKSSQSSNQTLSGNKGKYYDNTSQTWKAFQTSVTFHKNDGISPETTKTETVNYGSVWAATEATSWTKTGYTLANFYLDQACTDNKRITYHKNTTWKWVSNRTNYTTQSDDNPQWIHTGETQDVYAKWTANTYTVAFNANGGSAAAPASINGTYDQDLSALPNYSGTKTGYNFVGWNTADDGSGTDYAVGATPSNLTSTAGATVTLYAKWTPKTTKLYFDRQNESSTIYQTITYGASPVLADEAKSADKTGYTLNNYWTAADGGTQVTRLDGDYLKFVTGDVAGLLSAGKWASENETETIYAHWTPKNYNLNLDDNNGTGNIQHVNVTYMSSVISYTTPSKTGYNYGGYRTAQSSGTQVILTSQAFASSKSGWTDSESRWIRDEDNKTLYAKWTPITYKVAFYKNGGTGDNFTQNITYDAPTALTANPFTKEGHTFLGWNTDQTATVAQYTDQQEVLNLSSTPGDAGKVVLYAIWQAHTTTIHLQADGGSATDRNITATYGSTLDASQLTAADSTRTGYIYGGHFTILSERAAERRIIDDPNGYFEFVKSAYDGTFTDSNRKWKKDTSDVTLKAHWTARKCTLQLNNMGADVEGTTSKVVTYDDSPTKITPPQKTGKVFGGYYTADGTDNDWGSQIIGESGIFNDNVTNYMSGGKWAYPGTETSMTLYAKWENESKRVVTFAVTDGTSTTDQRGSISAKYKDSDVNVSSGDSVPFGTIVRISWDNSVKGQYYAQNGAYTCGKWYDNAVIASGTQIPGSGTNNYCDVTIASADINAYVYAQPVLYDITVPVVAHGTASASPTQAGPHFKSTLTATPATGYDFTGWSISNPDNAKFVDETTSSMTTAYLAAKAAVTVTPSYAIHNYSINYYDQDGAAFSGTSWTGSHPESYTVESEDFTIGTPSKTGYNFIGWYADATCETAATTTITQGSTGNKTFYAKWTAKQTIVTIYKNDGSDPESTASLTATYNSNVFSTDASSWTRTGYTLNNFWLNRTGDAPGTRMSADNDSFVKGVAGYTDDNRNWINESATMDWYAHWTETTHTITIVGGTAGSTTAGIATTGSATAATAATGKHFVNWTIPQSNFELVDCTIESSTITFRATADDMVVTANYEDTDYALHMVVSPAGKGTTVPTKDTIIHYNKLFSIKAIPATGYEFVNWESSNNGGSADIDFKAASAGGASVSARKTGIVISNDVEGAETGNARLVNPNEATLTANFQTITYTITYNTNGGTAVADGSYTVESETFALPTTTRTGFAFAGWYDNDQFTGSAVTQIVQGTTTGDKTFYAKWETTHVYLEGRARVKNAEGVETTINPNNEWVQTLKTIPFTFNSTDGVYYLNTYCTVLEQAANVGTGSNYIRMGIANGDGVVTPYGCNTENDYEFKPDAKGSVVGATNGGTNNKSFKFRNVENYENDNFKRRYPVMYRYNPTTNMFDYCAPLLTLTYSGTTATMTGYAIAIDSAKLALNGLKDSTIVYQYKQGESDWAEWTSDITAAAGTYKLRAVAFGNNEFGQHVDSVKSNEITVTVTTPAITNVQVTHVNGNPGSIIRVNDSFTMKHTVTGVPAGQSVKVCYHWSKKPAGSAIAHDIFTQVDGDPTSVWTSIDVAGDYEIEISVANDVCQDSLSNPGYIKWQTYTLPIHVKGDEITVYARLDTKIDDWNKKYVYYWRDAAGTWPGYEMSYIGKDSTDYEWYSYNIANYKSFQGGKLLFNDSTTRYGQYQTNNVDMPTDDEFYFIKTAMTGGKRDVALDPHIDVTKRVILQTDTTALYQYVTIALDGKGVFFANREEMNYTYTITSKPAGSGAALNAKNQFTPDLAGDYEVKIRCEAGSLNAENTFVLRVQPNPLKLTASVGATSTIGTGTTVTVSASSQAIQGTKTFTVIEPGTNSPITFSTKTDVAKSVTSDSYTMLSSGMYIFSVVVVNDGKIAGKAQDTVTVAAKEYWIKHPFVNKAEGSIIGDDWTWKKLTYNEIDGTYQYRGENGKGANFHPGKVANINNTASGDKLKEYHIVNPDNLNDNDSCIFVYDITLDTVTVYALNKRLYRIKSICQDNEYFSNAVTYSAEGSETQQVSFFAQKGGTLKWQTRATAADNWVDDATEVSTTASASGIYTATPQKLQANFTLTPYTDSLFVFSQAVTVNGAQHSPTALKGQLTQFTKKSESEYYNHYWVRYVEASTQAMATMGNRINNCIAITLPYYQMPASGNVRYAYDNTTNHFSRTFLSGSGDANFLRTYGAHLDTLVAGSSPAEYKAINSLAASKKFDDGSDWIYTAKASGEVSSTQSVTAILVAKYNNMNRWVLAESGLEADPSAEKVVLSKDAATAGRYDLTLIYDYKTNRLTAGAQPEPGTVIQDTMVIDQLILTREGDESATQFTLADKAKLIVVDKMTVELDVTKSMWTEWEDNTTGGGYKIMYFWFSVPYACRINEIYGMGLYGEKFEIQRYRGDLRASGEAGSATGKSAWRKLKATATMEANRGYVIAMRVNANDFKSATVGGVTKSIIRLYFPSVSKVELTHDVKTVLAQYVDSAKTSPLHWNWNIMGNPLVKSDKELIAEYSEIEGQAELNYIYEWTWGGGKRTYEPWAVDDITLKSTHSYMVQGHGDVYWSYPTASAPTRYLEAAQFASEDSYGTLNLRLNISQDEQLLDKTYIRYREDGSRKEYEMGRDLEKIINSGATQMYAVANNDLAAICLSSEDKEMIPLTVIANQNGAYSISLHRPLNSNLEPTIYDAQTQEYTNLSIGNFTTDLVKGTYENRFFFLLKKTGVVTNKEELNSNNFGDGVQKIIMNEKLYIIRDGKVYNATGSVVE